MKLVVRQTCGAVCRQNSAWLEHDEIPDELPPELLQGMDPGYCDVVLEDDDGDEVEYEIRVI